MSSDPNVVSGTDPKPDSHRNALIEALARSYGPALARFFERRVERKSDVPDLVQDVFLRLSRLGGISGIEKPESYIFRTALSALKDRARRGNVRHADRHEPFDELAHGGSDFSPARVLEGREAVAHLERALRSLPERTRDVFVLRMFEEQKVADIARVLGISTRATEKHYAKALAHVALALEAWRDR